MFKSIKILKSTNTLLPNTTSNKNSIWCASIYEKSGSKGCLTSFNKFKSLFIIYKIAQHLHLAVPVSCVSGYNFCVFLLDLADLCKPVVCTVFRHNFSPFLVIVKWDSFETTMKWFSLLVSYHDYSVVFALWKVERTSISEPRSVIFLGRWFDCSGMCALDTVLLFELWHLFLLHLIFVATVFYKS